jgi:hypothetical protein
MSARVCINITYIRGNDPLSLLDMTIVLIDIYSSSDGDLIEGDISYMLLAH